MNKILFWILRQTAEDLLPELLADLHPPQGNIFVENVFILKPRRTLNPQ
jgi:hypothetical protein